MTNDEIGNKLELAAAIERLREIRGNDLFTGEPVPGSRGVSVPLKLWRQIRLVVLDAIKEPGT